MHRSMDICLRYKNIQLHITYNATIENNLTTSLSPINKTILLRAIKAI